MSRQFPKFVHERCFYLMISACLCALLLLIALHLNTPGESTQRNTKGFFHLLVPATSTNKELCRLLLSTAALSFPSPRLINWGAHEDKDPYVQHVAKVASTLKYLDNLNTERDDDLLLLVDGYDVWFQLRPEVVLTRYYEVIDAENKRLEAQIGRHAMRKHGIYQSVVFGPDKICWPEDQRRPACWAVPESSVQPYAFGPETDSGRWRDHYRARWLNSGTIMGPIRDVRRVLKATLDRISLKDTDIVSDQYHFSNVWGEQEYARKLLSEENILLTQESWISDGWNGEGHYENITYDTPKIEPGSVSEYHITVDYESKLFQTMAYYFKYLGWVAYDSAEDTELHGSWTGFDQTLPEDIASSPAPLTSFTLAQVLDDEVENQAVDSRSRDPLPIDRAIPVDAKWQDFELGTNIVTRQVFSLLHFTPPKYLRDRWWNRMWYFPYGRAIIESQNVVTSQKLVRTGDGVEWSTYEEGERPSGIVRSIGGAWSDGGQWLSWNDLCLDHEAAVFHNVKEAEVEPPAPP